MIAIDKDGTCTDWQEMFLKMLAEIQKRLRRTFRHFDAERQDELIAEGIAHCLRSFKRLHDRGREHTATAFTLSRFAAMQIKSCLLYTSDAADE